MQNVTALGFRKGSDLSTLYASADVSIVPSSWEGFGFTVLEAMASGLPVIASRTGGIPEMIVDGESGILVELRGPDGNHRLDAAQVLAQAIVALVDAPARRRMLGVSARQRVEEHFTEKRLGDDLVALFASVKTDDPRHVQAGAW